MVFAALLAGPGLPAGLTTLGAAMTWAQPALSQGIEAQVQRLDDLTLLAQTLDIVALEGVAQGKELGKGLLGSPNDPSWSQALARVYDISRMRQLYDAALAEALVADPVLVYEVATFLTSPLGKRALELEVEARRTVIDEAAEAAAGEFFAVIKIEDAERLALFERLVVAADMIDSNVMSGLNGNFAFLKAMAKADPAQAGKIDEQTLLALVWENEPKIREDVIDFLYPVMALAYAPLSDEELDTYVGFIESPEGRRLTRALTLAFEAVLLDLSRELGAEAGRAISGQVL